MDPDQFKEFMNTFKELLTSKPTGSTAIHDPTDSSNEKQSTISIRTFESYKPETEPFKCYRQRFENYLDMNQLLQNKELSAKILLNSIGATHYNMLSALVSPKVPNELTYDELINAIETHLSPKKNILVSQNQFLLKYQGQNQSIPEYIAELRRDIIDCEFISPCQCKISIADIFLRAQLVRGLRDNSIREQLLQSEAQTFDDISKKAIALEASKSDCTEISKKSSITEYNENVNKISRSRSVNRDMPKSHQVKLSTSRKRSTHTRDMSTKRNRKSINLKELGLENVCLHCGKSNHTTSDCRIKNKLNCQFCHKKGHIKRVCISELLKLKSDSKNNNMQYIEDADCETPTNFEICQILNISHCTNDDRMFVNIQINGIPVRFECDSGSRVSIMNIDQFKKLQVKSPILQTNISFRSYTGDVFKPVGYVKLNVSCQENTSLQNLYLVDLKKDPILGREWIRNLNINLNAMNTDCVKQISTTDINNSIDTLKKKYADVFEQKIGKIPNYTCQLKLHSDAKPIFIKPRTVPYALRSDVEKEIERLESQDIIQKVEHSEWGTPLVVVPKSDGSIRICADYKVTVNSQLHDARHPIPRIEDIFNKLRGGSYFCTLDIYKAYLHLPVDEESAKVQTISTHKGTYIAKRLFFGIKTAPNEFHSFIDQFIQGLDGVVAYFDDLIVQGQTYEECYVRLQKLLDKLQQYNLHVNITKCKFFQHQVEYLGHIISSEGLSKSPDKVKAIKDAPRPKSADEVRQFLGLVMYYSKFMKNASTLLYPLNQLLRKNIPFHWTATCEAAWINAKSEIASDQVLVPFTPDLPVVLATDASPFGLSGILSHTMPDGSERPIAFASRSLTTAEKNYSQLDKEATAVYWACKKFYDFLYGRKFTLVVDNKPMMTILHPEKKLPVLSATRMLRYAQFLSGFDYTIMHRSSSDHTNADYLSRSPLPLNQHDIQLVDDDYQYQESIVNTIATETITSKDIQRETTSDPELSQLKTNILEGNLYDTELTVQEGILFRGTRVIIPQSLQPAILQELHSTHVGIVKMKALARNYCYWKNIDKDIEALVKSCKQCCDVKTNPAKAPIHNWEVPTKNWQRVHFDYAGPFMGHFFLLVVDAKSKWPEIYATKRDPTTASTIHYLREIFSRHGLPEILVSDNASIFKSKEFTDFCSRIGTRQRLIAPGHPATNGQAERYVQILKQKLKCMKFQPGTLHEKLHELLFRYRATPLACGKTPAELLYGHNLRTKLDLLRPVTSSAQRNNAKQPNFNKFFRPGDRVQSRNYTNSTKWKYGVIVERLGQVHYLVELDDGYIIKRHFDQLRLCEVDRQSVPLTDQFTNCLPRKKTVSFRDDVKPEITEGRTAGPPNHSSARSGPPALDARDLSTSAARALNSTINPPVPPQTPRGVQLRRSTRIRKPVERLNL